MGVINTKKIILEESSLTKKNYEESKEKEKEIAQMFFIEDMHKKSSH